MHHATDSACFGVGNGLYSPDGMINIRGIVTLDSSIFPRGMIEKVTFVFAGPSSLGSTRSKDIPITESIVVPEPSPIPTTSAPFNVFEFEAGLPGSTAAMTIFPFFSSSFTPR